MIGEPDSCCGIEDTGAEIGREGAGRLEIKGPETTTAGYCAECERRKAAVTRAGTGRGMSRSCKYRRG